MSDWPPGREPKLGDVALATSRSDGDPAELERAYLVVGVEEGRVRGNWRLLLERVAWQSRYRDDYLNGFPRAWAFYPA